MLRVIDISDYQASLDFGGVNADAIIVKATGGNGYVNPSCDNHIEQAKAANKPFAFYHYYSDGFNDSDPIAEANYFVDNCLGYFNQGIPILDWERGGNPDVSDTAKALQFLQHVEARTGVKPLIYMSLSLVTGLNWSAVVANNNGLWCADYVDNNTPIPNFAMDPNRDPNPHWDGTVNDVMWQFTSTGRIDGYGGNLDCSFFYGPRAAWDAYANKHASPAPTPEPTTTTTTTTAAPLPEPSTTTTTTTETTQPPTATTTTSTSEPAPGESTTTTTTTTKKPQPLPPSTTTTTTQATNPPGFWAGVVAGIKAILKALFGKVEE